MTSPFLKNRNSTILLKNSYLNQTSFPPFLYKISKFRLSIIPSSIYTYSRNIDLRLSTFSLLKNYNKSLNHGLIKFYYNKTIIYFPNQRASLRARPSGLLLVLQAWTPRPASRGGWSQDRRTRVYKGWIRTRVGNASTRIFPLRHQDPEEKNFE